MSEMNGQWSTVLRESLMEIYTLLMQTNSLTHKRINICVKGVICAVSQLPLLLPDPPLFWPCVCVCVVPFVCVRVSNLRVRAFNSCMCVCVLHSTLDSGVDRAAKPYIQHNFAFFFSLTFHCNFHRSVGCRFYTHTHTHLGHPHTTYKQNKQTN